jgi:pre-mRNA-processing factor 17
LHDCSIRHGFYCLLQVISTFGAGKMFYVAKLHPNEDKQNMLFGGCGDKKVYQFDVDTGDAIQVHSTGK